MLINRWLDFRKLSEQHFRELFKYAKFCYYLNHRVDKPYFMPFLNTQSQNWYKEVKSNVIYSEAAKSTMKKYHIHGMVKWCEWSTLCRVACYISPWAYPAGWATGTHSHSDWTVFMAFFQTEEAKSVNSRGGVFRAFGGKDSSACKKWKEKRICYSWNIMVVISHSILYLWECD